MKEHKIFFEEQFTYTDENPFYVQENRISLL